MHIEITPETQSLIEHDVQRGPYRSAGDFVEQAVAMLHEHEEWLSGNQPEISAKIEAGYASAQRGELTGGDDVRIRMGERKRAWLAQQPHQSK